MRQLGAGQGGAARERMLIMSFSIVGEYLMSVQRCRAGSNVYLPEFHPI